MEDFLMIGLLLVLCATGIAIAFMRDLLVVAMLSGIFSFVCCAVFVLFDAPDVAFTEACVGAGVSTVLTAGTAALRRSPRAVADSCRPPLYRPHGRGSGGAQYRHRRARVLSRL